MFSPLLKARPSRQLPGQAEDPTSSLVLRSKRGYYVDVRVRRGITPNEPELPNEGGPIERLLLARAGRCGTDGKSQTEPPSRKRCAEWIQETSVNSDQARNKEVREDKEEWKTQRSSPVGFGQLVGQAVIADPVTGAPITFDELSIELPVSPVNCDGIRTSIVLRIRDEERDVRGTVVRVGEWCQGILQIGHDISVERWKWVTKRESARYQHDYRHLPHQETRNTCKLAGRDSSDDIPRPSSGQEYGDRGEWERQVRIGSRWLPCSVTFVESMVLGSVQEGAIVQAGDMIWTVVERYVWSE